MALDSGLVLPDSKRISSREKYSVLRQRQIDNNQTGFTMRLRTTSIGMLTFCALAMIGTIAAPGVLGQGEEFRSPQSIDGSRGGQPASRSAPPQVAGAAGVSEADRAAQRQKIFAALFKELDNMIPGNFESGSAKKTAVEDAVRAFQVQDLNKVREIFEGLSKQDKFFPPTELLLASLSYAVQDAKSGLILLERAAVKHPDYPGLYTSFARLAISQNRTSDALALLEKCEKKINGSTGMPQPTKDYFMQQLLDGLTDVAMRQGRFDVARTYLDKQRAALPDNAKVLMVSAELEFKEGKIEKSLEYLNLLKSKYPSTRVPESVLATWSMRSNKPDEGEKWIRSAAEKYPDLPQVQLEFASWAVDNEDFPTASSAIIRAEKAGSESVFSRNLKGKIAFCNQSYGTAELHYQAISQKQPNNFDSVNMYALSLIESKDENKRKLAEQIAIKNAQSLPDNLVAQAALGYIELKLGRVEEARTLIGRVAQTPGAAPEISYFVASLLNTLGETQEAKKIVDSSLKHKGIFLYRKAAEQLSRELAKSTGSLPAPGK